MLYIYPFFFKFELRRLTFSGVMRMVLPICTMQCQFSSFHEGGARSFTKSIDFKSLLLFVRRVEHLCIVYFCEFALSCHFAVCAGWNGTEADVEILLFSKIILYTMCSSLWRSVQLIGLHVNLGQKCRQINFPVSSACP